MIFINSQTDARAEKFFSEPEFGLQFVMCLYLNETDKKEGKEE
jgi:hypothetical protein